MYKGNIKRTSKIIINKPLVQIESQMQHADSLNEFMSVIKKEATDLFTCHNYVTRDTWKIQVHNKRHREISHVLCYFST